MPKEIKILNWNVNSVNARLARVVNILDKHKPDVVCFQEIKTIEDNFPRGPFEDRGYHCYLFGQKAYNGVCVLSKQEAIAQQAGFQDGVEDAAARFLWVRFKDFSVASAYIPNGQEVGSPAYEYKLTWLTRLKTFIERHNLIAEKFVLTGDFNIAPEEIDVYDPKVWRNRIHFSDPEREKMRELQALGLVDSFRSLYPSEQKFSWWDYRNLSFAKNLGLRIDILYVTPALRENLVDCFMDREERKGEKPSDHIPIVGVFKL